jgi:hypothetical protein
MIQRTLVDVIASRRLTMRGRQIRQLTVRFERPRRSGRDWVCWFELRGLGQRTFHRSYGVDSLQALTLAVEHARSLLEHRGLRVTGTFADLPGGLPRIVIAPFGRAENEEVNRILDRATLRIARRLVREGKRRPRGAAA